MSYSSLYPDIIIVKTMIWICGQFFYKNKWNFSLTPIIVLISKCQDKMTNVMNCDFMLKQNYALNSSSKSIIQDVDDKNMIRNKSGWMSYLNQFIHLFITQHFILDDL